MIAPFLLACTVASQESPQALPLRIEGGRDATGEGIAFVEAVPARTDPFVAEPVRVVVRFGVEAEFLATKAVQPFGRPLDVPVQLTSPWIGAGAGSATFALNEGWAQAGPAEDRVLDGRTYRTFEIVARVAAAAPGEVRLEAPRLAFAYATKFEESLVRGRAPLDRVDAFVVGSPLVLTARPWPAEGRPEEFTGAVGDLRVHA